MQTTYEGVVENGLVKLNQGVRLPDHTKVYVVIAEQQRDGTVRIMSPRLANSEDAEFLKKEFRKKS